MKKAEGKKYAYVGTMTITEAVKRPHLLGNCEDRPGAFNVAVNRAMLEVWPNGISKEEMEYQGLGNVRGHTNRLYENGWIRRVGGKLVAVAVKDPNDQSKCKRDDCKRLRIIPDAGAEARAGLVNSQADSEVEETGLVQGSLADGYLRYTPEQLKIIEPRHAKLSHAFQRWLEDVGATSVKAESNGVDVCCMYEGRKWLFELKICQEQSTRHALREGLGQVLEYSFFPGRPAPDHLAIVLDKAPSTREIGWFRNLMGKGIAVEVFWFTHGRVHCAKVTDQPLTQQADAN